ncbi:MAG: enoyl-CoA hydratase/isomerase family protein [Pirellulaceae bacterium]|nr:enoyl-CoA hydratase/isomerase family protein [Pirellulaceae bacterium]
MQHVDVKVHQSVATITMDRAETHNALSPTLMQDLRTAFSDIHQEKRVKAVVLTGAGQHFCSGVDMQVLSEISELPQQDAASQWYLTWRQLTEMFEELLRLPKPVIAAIDGSAIGAGFGLALACDMIVVSEQAQLSANAVQHGLVGGATAALLAFRCGGATASRLVLSGQAIDASEAHRLGICGPPVPSDQIWVAANQLAQQCGHGPREALQANKRLLNERIGEQLMAQLAAGAADSATACSTDSAVEGIRAFVAGREPQWPQ